MRLLRCFLALVFAWVAQAQDTVLRARLHAEMRASAEVIPYSSSNKFDTADALALIDTFPGDTNVIHLIYGHTMLPTATFGDTGGWNREHHWPNSYGLDDREPAFSDLHNLRACDSNVNSARGNKFYDLTSAADGSLKDPAHAEAPLCTTDANSWQPPSDQRGDIARALFYMDVRYEGDVAGEPDLRLVEDVSRITSSTNLMGRLSTLLHWNEEDPPDDAERLRDELVNAVQSNRNPFVAHPELAPLLYLPKLTLTLELGFPAFGGFFQSDLPLVVETATSPAGPWTEYQPDHTLPDGGHFFRLRLK